MSVTENLQTTRPAEVLARLKPLYTLVNEPDVIKFLVENPELGPFLETTRSKLAEYFPAATFALEFVADYEVPDWFTLFVKVNHNYQPDERMERRDKFYFDWWLDFSHLYSAKVALWI